MQPEQKNKRKGIIATVMYHVILLLLFLFVGLTYQDPPPEDGIAINFGYEDDGSGNTTQSAPQQPQPQQEEVEKETAETIDEVATQEVEEAPNVTEEKVEKPKEKPEEEPKEEPKPTPDSRLQNALDKTKNQEGQGEGEGEKEGGGDQGDPNGDRNSPNREGNGGTGNSGDYQLGGRKALSRPKPVYDCPEEGRVVVKVYVNRTGEVIDAIAGEKIPNGPGSTTSSSCLYSRAVSAAKRTTWQGDPNAPERQVGYIIYNFKKR